MSVVAAAAPAVAGIGSTAVSPLISAIMSQSMKRRLSGSGEGGRRGVPRYQPVSRLNLRLLPTRTRAVFKRRLVRLPIRREPRR
jgi:hypothetical protein